jgi:hypothetical protein
VPTVTPEPPIESNPASAKPIVNHWRLLIFVGLTLFTVFIVWAYTTGFFTRGLPQPSSQQVTVVLEVVVADTNQTMLDGVFREAYQAHISDTYGTEWSINGELKFVGAPPEVITQQNGQITYRGRVTATITTLP